MNTGSIFKAHIVPFGVFMLFLGLVEIIPKIFGYGSFWTLSPQYWIYPLQTAAAGGLLCWYWSSYRLAWPRLWTFTLAVAGLVLAIWIAPQEWFGLPARWKGFDPNTFSEPVAYWASLSFRFLRLVIVVPLVEEIFWRGFLLRHFINEDFEKVPFGTFSWLSFGAVTICFALAHLGPDFWPALITGALYNLVAYRTKSLASCILAHAVTNLLLGIYIMQTGQWGFW